MANLTKFECEYCGKGFTSVKPHAKFCSSVCRSIWHNNHRNHIKQMLEPILDKNCKNCNKVFTPIRRGVFKFCSPKCRLKYNRDKTNEKQKAKRRQLKAEKELNELEQHIDTSKKPITALNSQGWYLCNTEGCNGNTWKVNGYCIDCIRAKKHKTSNSFKSVRI